MNKLSYIFNSEGIILFINNKPTKVLKGTADYAKIVSKFDLPKDQQVDAILEVLNSSTKTLTFKNDEFDVTPENVTFNGVSLPNALATKVRNLFTEKLPLDLFKEFWKNIQLNPSATSINELYDFLEYKELPLTEDGCFLAYKGVGGDFWSYTGNLKTVVLQGVVCPETGRILNTIGATIEVGRNQVDDNREEHCSFGLHVGSLEYAKDFAKNGKLLVVKVNPKDVVSVPSDYSCQKCRVSKYEVLSEFVEEITSPAVDEDYQPIESVAKKEDKKAVDDRSEFLTRLNTYIVKQLKNNFNVSVRKIQNSFSPNHPSRERILEAVTELGWTWYNTENGPVVGTEEEDY